MSAEEKEAADFVAVVLADTEQTRQKIFAASGNRYHQSAGSRQRVAWFRRGFEGGDIVQCDTFAAGIRSKAAWI